MACLKQECSLQLTGYGLTRLALATGGTFTAINRPGDIAAATREELFEYMPDYRSLREIAYDIDRYYQEQSPRWKAWYDLNLGRLLAHSVRIHEFILQCEFLAGPQARVMMLDQGFNQLQMKPSQEMKGGPASVTRTQTAVKLLERVVREHADTPWGDLAAWELEHPVGVEPVLSVRPPPRRVGPMVPRRPPPLRPTLPLL